MNTNLLSRDNLQFVLSKCVDDPPLMSESIHTNYPPLQDVTNVNIQQALIINDMLAVLLGLEGFYIRFSNQYSQGLKQFQASPNESSLTILLRGPDFKVSKSLNSSLKDMTKTITRIGKIYVSLKYFVMFFDSQYMGKINQSMACFIRDVLNEYLHIVNSVYLKSKTTDYNVLLMNNDLKNDEIDLKMRILHEICQLVYKDTKQRAGNTNEFQSFITGLKSDFLSAKAAKELDLNFVSSKFTVCKGGLVLSVIGDQIQKNQGNPDILKFLNSLFNTVSSHYLLMLNKWLVNGVVDDIFDEFLIKCNSEKTFTSLSIFQGLNPQVTKSSERYWDSKFSIRKDGLPKQLAEYSLKQKIFLTGTYLNIIKDCGILIKSHDLSNMFNRSHESDHLIRSLTQINLLNLHVDYWYHKADTQIMNLLYHGYDFIDLIHTFKQFFFVHGPYLTGISNVLDSNLDNMRNSVKYSRAQHHMNELQKDFALYLDTKDLVLKLGELKLEPNDIFGELEEILNVMPLNSEQLLNTSSYQALTNIVNEVAVVGSSHSEDKNHVSFDDYLVNHIGFELILPFPLNLVINQTEVIKFQLIFRFLLTNAFLIKFLEQNFVDVQSFFKTSIDEDHKSKVSKLSIINFKYLGALKQLYTSYQQTIVTEFDSLLDIISSFNDANSKLTFENTKNSIQNMLDNILLYTKLTDRDFLRLMKNYFKRSLHFVKYCKLILKEFKQAGSQNGFQTTSGDHLPRNQKFVEEFESYIGKFAEEFTGFEVKIGKFLQVSR